MSGSEGGVKVLAVSDHVVPSLYTPRVKQQFGDVEMVLACGDLAYSYLEYIATMLNVPCFFVHGNHDRPEYLSTQRTLSQPGGWLDLDQRTAEAKGVLLGGLEGSVSYRPHAPYQYTEAEMSRKALRLVPSLLANRLRRGRYLDVLITHAPPLGIHDADDPAHRGFEVFRRLMTLFRPRYLLHGHQHTLWDEPDQTVYQETCVINVYPYKVIEW
jgi:Icc-related predicted phosphoesterase